MFLVKWREGEDSRGIKRFGRVWLMCGRRDGEVWVYLWAGNVDWVGRMRFLGKVELCVRGFECSSGRLMECCWLGGNDLGVDSCLCGGLACMILGGESPWLLELEQEMR